MAWPKILSRSSRINGMFRCLEGETVTLTLEFLRMNLSETCHLGVYYFLGFYGVLTSGMSHWKAYLF